VVARELCREQVRVYRFRPHRVSEFAGLSNGWINRARIGCPAQHVIEQVLKSGYTQVTQLEADDGRWVSECIKDGKKMDFHADPKTGVITFERFDDWREVTAV
jgi:hypothetical protein